MDRSSWVYQLFKIHMYAHHAKSTCPLCFHMYAHCAKSTCPFMQIMKTIMLWSLLGTDHCAHFAAYSEILAHPTRLAHQIPHRQLTEHCLYLACSIILKKSFLVFGNKSWLGAYTIPVVNINCCYHEHQTGGRTKEEKGSNVHITIPKSHSIQIPSEHTWKTSS